MQQEAIKPQIKIAGKVFNVDLEALMQMAYRIETSVNLNLYEVRKTLDGLLRDNPGSSISIEYALRRLEESRNTLNQISGFYEMEKGEIEN